MKSISKKLYPYPVRKLTIHNFLTIVKNQIYKYNYEFLMPGCIPSSRDLKQKPGFKLDKDDFLHLEFPF